MLSAEVVNLIIDENLSHSFSGRYHAEKLKKKIRKLGKEGKLTTHFLDNPGEKQLDWGFRIFAANMLLGDYSWWGWECRSKWAWDLVNHDWFYPRWQGKPCKLLVVAEQGLGDEILFASCAKEMARNNPDLHWEVDSRLIPVLQRSIPEINWITRWKEERRNGDNKPYQLNDHRGEYDAYIPAGNVPKLFRTHKKAFPREPYLKPDPERLERFKKYQGKWGFVSQAGGSQEKTTSPEGLGEVNLHHSLILEDCENAYPQDFEDLIALISNLEGVNSVPSAIVHLCGSLGKTCNVIMPKKFTGTVNTILKWYYPKDGGKMDWYGDPVYVFPSRKAFDHSNRRPRKEYFSG